MSEKPEIQYAFEQRPDAGETMQVADGIHWLRMPLPFVLGHINLWLLQDGGDSDNDWTIIDTGVDIEESEKVWTKTIDAIVGDGTVSRVLVTHLHPDHVGCAGWLCDRHDADLWMTREEYLLCRILVADTGRPVPEEGYDFYRAAGFDESALVQYEKMFGFFGKFVSRLPQAYRRINDDETIRIGKNEWRVIIGSGHSPEHACLYCEEQNLLISGDQLLPTISSNVSVFPTEPLANPLHAWITSLQKLKSEVPHDVVVLPAHGKPFRGAHERLDALVEEHRDGLLKLVKFCDKPQRAVDVYPALFKREIVDRNRIMATGEAIAHLNYLVDDGRITSEADSSGVIWYQRV